MKTLLFKQPAMMGRFLTWLLAMNLMTLVSYGAFPPVLAEAVLHFDASDVLSLMLMDGAVQSWSDAENRGRLFAGCSAEMPMYNADLKSIRFDGVNDFLNVEVKDPLSLGSISVFIVARFASEKADRFLFSTEGDKRFNLSTDGEQFVGEVGPLFHARKHGPHVDTKMHVFELSHVLLKDPNQGLLPGHFAIDGVTAGRPFCRDTDAISDTLVFGAADQGVSSFFQGDIFEIVVFTEIHSPEAKGELLQHLSEKWSIAVRKDGCDDVPVLEPIPLAAPEEYASLGIYGRTPESPDGNRIAYIKFDEEPLKDAPYSTFSIWIRGAHLETLERCIKRVPNVLADAHNGAFLQWVDNTHLMYCGFETPKQRGGKKGLRVSYVIDADTGEVTRGSYTGAFLSEGAFDGKIILSVEDGRGNVGPQGLYVLDTNNGDLRCIVTLEDLIPFTEGKNWAGFNPDTRRWKLPHPQFSPQGTRISFELSPRGVAMLFTCRPNGSELALWGVDKILHEQWFDEDTFCGADEMTDDGYSDNLSFRRWDLNKNVVETLGGPVNHTALSDDRQLVAGETFYGQIPVELRVYRRGETHPFVRIPLGNPEVIWTHRGHVNPSFSRDGRRLYFNAAPKGHKQPCYVRLEGFVD